MGKSAICIHFFLFWKDLKDVFADERFIRDAMSYMQLSKIYFQ